MKRTATVLALVLVAAATARAQDKVKLELRAKKGDKLTRTSLESTKGKLKVDTGGNQQEIEVLEKNVMKYKDEVLEVDGNDASKVKRQITEWWKEEKKPMQEDIEKSEKTLQGKTITLSKKGAETEIEGAADLPEDEKKKNRLRQPVFLSSLPKDEVAVGATWDVDDKALLNEMVEDMGESPVEMKTAKAKGKLTEVKEEKGKKVATITYDVEATGEVQASIKVAYKMKIIARLDLTSGRMIDMKGDGTADVKGDGEQGGSTFSITGQLEFKMEQAWTFE